jgi:Membrane bound O-acyl transferase family
VIAARRAIGWTILIGGTIGIDRLGASRPPVERMLALIAFALLAMKAIVVIEERARGMPPLPLGGLLAFSLPGVADLLRRGARCLLLGGVLVAIARIARHDRLAATAILLVGLSLVLHFGLCSLLAGLWRSRGFDCDALFRAPLRSESLGEFWSRRWNVGFSEMTAIAIFRPLVARIGRGPALFAGFVLSGLLHEMAISLPVRAGFGQPLLYFLVQGALVLVEERTNRFGRLGTLACVALPLPVLFHRAFLEGVIQPLVGIGG